MEKKKMVHVIRQENIPQELERFCTERPTLPLIMFYDTCVTPDYYPMKTMEEVSAEVFGLGQMKKVSYECNNISSMDKQIEFLKELPQQLFVVQCGPRLGGYDGVVLYAERLMKTTGKHVIAMIADGNSIQQKTLLSSKISYADVVVETFLTWQGRTQVWVADRTACYRERQQVYLGRINHGIIDMLKSWSEEGRKADVMMAVADNKFLNEAYKRYIDSCEDIPYMLKYTDFDERLITEEQATEYGTILSIKADSIEAGGAYLASKYRFVKRELKLDVEKR